LIQPPLVAVHNPRPAGSMAHPELALTAKRVQRDRGPGKGLRPAAIQLWTDDAGFQRISP